MQVLTILTDVQQALAFAESLGLTNLDPRIALAVHLASGGLTLLAPLLVSDTPVTGDAEIEGIGVAEQANLKAQLVELGMAAA